MQSNVLILKMEAENHEILKDQVQVDFFREKSKDSKYKIDIEGK